jgi:Pycsar effector protein
MGMTRSRFLTMRRVLSGARSVTDDPPPANVEYLRLMYASTRDWYTAAETKAQLLLAVNGVFVTLLFGFLFGNADGVHAGSRAFGLDTLIFASVSVLALLAAVSCAVLSLWSLHGRAGRDFARLGVEPAAPDSYRPEVLWYFGYLARLPPDAAEAQLRAADRKTETEALIYHVIDLSRKVLRKHRWVNAGWALTALALFALAATGTSFLLHSRLQAASTHPDRGAAIVTVHYRNANDQPGKSVV